jgi:hypothetical protein
MATSRTIFFVEFTFSEPFQSYKIALKSCEQSIIEHSLVTIYFNLEWSDHKNTNPNLLIHIFDKSKTQSIRKEIHRRIS